MEEVRLTKEAVRSVDKIKIMLNMAPFLRPNHERTKVAQQDWLKSNLSCKQISRQA